MRKNLLFIFFIGLVNSVSGQSPNWEWARRAGRFLGDGGQAITNDQSGNVYVAGIFSSDTIVFGNDTLSNTQGSANQSDIFIAKYDGSGNSIWARGANSWNSEQVSDAATDNAGNVYVTGWFGSPKVIFGQDTLFNPLNPGNWASDPSMFLVKYDSSGNVLWARTSENSSDNKVYSISIDALGCVYIVGGFTSDSISIGSFVLHRNGSEDAFIAKYNTIGTVVWATSFGGNNYDEADAISIDNNGAIYITGSFNSATVTVGAFILNNSNTSYYDMFLSKCDTAGNIIWAKRFETGLDPKEIAIDSAGNIFVTGGFSSAYIVFDTITLYNSGNNDMFISKFDNNGYVQWAKKAGGNDWEYGTSICVDKGENIILGGNFQSSSISFGATTLLNNSSSLYLDMFLVKYSNAGNILWAINAGGTGSDYLADISTDNNMNIYATGYFISSFIWFGSTALNNAGGSDLFVSKLGFTTGVDVISTQENLITLFPNPAQSSFTISLNEFSSTGSQKTLQILDLTGRCVYEKAIRNQESEIINRNFSPGVYFVKVSDGERSETQKLVIQ